MSRPQTWDYLLIKREKNMKHTSPHPEKKTRLPQPGTGLRTQPFHDLLVELALISNVWEQGGDFVGKKYDRMGIDTFNLYHANMDIVCRKVCVG